MHSKDAPANFIFLDGVSESVDWLVGKKILIFAFDFLSKPNLDINTPNWASDVEFGSEVVVGFG